jgi:hypothetical protein
MVNPHVFLLRSIRLVGDLQFDNVPNRPLNPPIWGTSGLLEVPQIGGFRGRSEYATGILFFRNDDDYRI